MRCPNCGSESPDDVRFCQRCGAPLGGAVGAPGAPPGYYQPPPPPPAKKSNMVWIIVVVVVAIIVVLAVVAALLASSFFHSATHQDLEMTVTNVGTPTSFIVGPAAGDKYVQLTILVDNNGQLPLTLSNIYFSVDTSTGVYQATSNVNSDTMGAIVYAGGSTMYFVSFEVPNSATLEKVTYSSPFGSAEANVP